MIKDGVGLDWAGNIISFGALVAITSVVLTILYGQTRIMFAMCRDGLMPRNFAKVNDKTKTPIRITATFGVLIALVAAFVPLKEIVKLVNIGTLFAFIVVNVGVIILRRTKPDLERGYRVPFVPWFPIIGSLLCVYLMRTSRSRRGCGSSAGWCSGSSSTSPTGSGTRACARARPSTPRPSFQTPRNGFPPALGGHG